MPMTKFCGGLSLGGDHTCAIDARTGYGRCWGGYYGNYYGEAHVPTPYVQYVGGCGPGPGSAPYVRYGGGAGPRDWRI